jgi:hypothetical protein
MRDRNINGIGNMISHSFEAAHKFIELQQNSNEDFVPLLKKDMYNIPNARLRSYGWEHSPSQLFNINKYKIELIKTLGGSKSNIIWGDRITKLINSTTNTNNLFK